MKLIITIPKNKYCYIQELEQGNTDYATTRMLYHAVKHGKLYLEQEPEIDTLDKIRAEIAEYEEEVFHRTEDYSDYAAVRYCLEIIDKYKAESEVDS